MASAPPDTPEGYLELVLAPPGGVGRVDGVDGLGGFTRLARLSSRAPLRVLRAIHPDPTLPGLAGIPIVHLGGGLLAGERLRLNITVQGGAQAHFTAPGATHLYPMPDGGMAQQDLRLEVGQGALAEWLPYPLIPHANTCYRQQATLVVHLDARLFFAESLVAGRHEGEAFSFVRLENRTEVRTPAGDLLAADALVLEPGVLPCTAPGAFGPYRALGNVLLITEAHGIEPLAKALSSLPGFTPGLGERRNAEAVGLSGAPPLLAGFSRLPGTSGLTVRLLGKGGAQVGDAIRRLWRCWRRCVVGQQAPDLRW